MDIAYTVQASHDLATWTDIAGSTGGATTVPLNGSGVTISDNGAGLRNVQVSIPLVAGSQVSMRLQITYLGNGSVSVTTPAISPATASAGGNQTICAGSATAALGGSVGGCATGGQWTSSGTGTFAPDATTLNATYTPSAGDIAAGTVTLTLTSSGQESPCGAATAQVFVTILPPATGTVTNVILTGAAWLVNGTFQFGFTNTPCASFTALAATNLALPLSNWTVLGPVTEVSPGQFQFTDAVATNGPQRYYRVGAP